MGGYQLLHFYTTSHVSRLKLLAQPFVPTLRRYTKENYEHHAEEKAPTTAEEFVRVAEEMVEQKEHQGTDYNFESVKENFKVSWERELS
ncbi:hypothetical protein RND71_037685 [Anisodus tanguticus]|uniref:Uncharacterized protein n=1 Tax=Anisodus tanguticus TaxID=243964 RepID=A0AAE1QZ78_9SOLA|nr:hypothetical protein RND71_037685 [Anisodus tanguticus]